MNPNDYGFKIKGILIKIRRICFEGYEGRDIVRETGNQQVNQYKY